MFGLLGELVKAEAAAAKVEGFGVFGGLGLEPGVDGVEPLLAALLCFEQAGFAEDAEVLGDVGLREVQVFGDGGDAEALLVEEAEDAETRFFAERFQGADASEAIHGGTG